MPRKISQKVEKAEAKLYLQETDDLAIEDAYEIKLFEWKNFFVHRFPVTKLYASKIIQLERVVEAYTVLSGVSAKVSPRTIEVDFPKNLKEAFSLYTIERNRLKTEMFACTSGEGLIQIVKGLLQLTQAYALVWANDFELTEEVRVSQEPDAMAFMEALNDGKSKGVNNIEDVLKLPQDHLVRSEAKRLSLWTKMDNNE